MSATYYVCLYLGNPDDYQGTASPTDGVVFDRLRDARDWARNEWDSYEHAYRIVKVRVERVCDEDTGGER